MLLKSRIDQGSFRLCSRCYVLILQLSEYFENLCLPFDDLPVKSVFIGPPYVAAAHVVNNLNKQSRINYKVINSFPFVYSDRGPL